MSKAVTILPEEGRVLAAAGKDKEVDCGEEGDAADDGDYAQDDEQEDEQRDEQELKEAIEEASRGETVTENDYYEDYSDGSSSVVAVKKVKAKTNPTTPGDRFRDHVQYLSATCGDLVHLEERTLPYNPFHRDAEELLMSKDGENRGQCAVGLKDNTQLGVLSNTRICHKCHSKSSFLVPSDLHKPEDGLIDQSGRVFAQARAVVLQTQTILNGTATSPPDGGYRCYSKASEAYPTKIRDAHEHAKMMKQAELLVQKHMGVDEHGGKDECPSKRKNDPATHFAKRSSLKNMARIQPQPNRYILGAGGQTTTTHQKGTCLSTGMHRAPTPVPTPTPHFQSAEKATSTPTAKNQMKQSGKK
ncbi:hypothetical protein BDK51DRAFT_30996 [Blyttiomyces helicus]|uniref:Uncharacterized protein n=1 Tax=Blyttiomyces helicus TaxID=388810 RepID=A0A4P9WJX5_9FUNG|nr:hypothetical protein BDK51DRAFT_30996 [Blyttiomyces helicus]|eukprot:RKO90966.1 hypothetical protein BDK51DRAFT_30996 [Blyttiomyces helicus]